MDIIHDPTVDFNFEKLLLTSPTVVTGGNHFIKYLFNSNPLYIRTPKCSIKQGVITAGKKIYCDLMFTNEHEEFIQWLENLENYSQNFIFDKREKWFETNLEQHDIENSFTSPIKIFKSGKYYILRCIVPTVLGKSDLKIYDESENLLDIDKLKENTPIVSVLEIQGIKCSPRGFQIDIEIKQLLVLKPTNLFDKCVLLSLASNNQKNTKPNDDANVDVNVDVDVDVDDEASEESESENKDDESDIKSIEEIEILDVLNDTKDDLDDSEENKEPPVVIEDTEEPEENSELPPFLEEVNFNLDEIPEEEFVLKNRNEVYYEMYKEAMKKAKIAKDLALSSYLEAKRIKNIYMLDDLTDDEEYEYNDYDNEDEKEFEKI